MRASEDRKVVLGNDARSMLVDGHEFMWASCGERGSMCC